MDYIAYASSIPMQAVATGLLSHLIFKRYEPNVLVFIAVVSVLILVHFGVNNSHQLIDRSSLHLGDLVPTLKYTAYYFATLLASISIYRLYINPLRHFPGDKFPALTKWQAFFIQRSGKVHTYLLSQHQKYGDYVRVGPNEISVADFTTISWIHGAQSKFPKGPWYSKNLSEPEPPIFSIRPREEHRIRRKAWDQALGSKALKGYESEILAQLELLIKQYGKFADTGEVFDFSEWTEYWAFDVMGKLGFSHQFNMLQDGSPHEYVDFVHKALRLMTTFATVSWIMPIMAIAPIDRKTRESTARFINLGRDMFVTRKAQKSEAGKMDIFDYFLHAGDTDPEAFLTDIQIEGEGRAVIIGGSDTTAVAMVSLFCYILHDKRAYDKLAKEIRAIEPDSDAVLDGARLGDTERAPYLNACISEALRLVPPGPNGMQRVVTTLGGVTLDGKWIPEGTCISVHGFSIHRDPRNFSEPDKFIPERWVAGSDFKGNHESSAFIPFSVGAYQCVGRKLAWLELRMLTVKLLQHFDFEIGPGFSINDWIDEKESYLTMTKGSLPVKIKPFRV